MKKVFTVLALVVAVNFAFAQSQPKEVKVESTCLKKCGKECTKACAKAETKKDCSKKGPCCGSAKKAS